jgi:mRNA interferase RelE/StbE
LTVLWRVRWDPHTRTDLERIGRPAAERIRKAVLSRLATDPHKGLRLKTTSDVPLYRFRVGDYRVLYALREEEILILILRVGHRKEIYRGV